MKFRFVPVDYNYFDFDGRNYVQVFGRDSSGRRFCVIDSFYPKIWAILEKGLSDKKIKKLKERILDVRLDEKNRETKVENLKLVNKNFLDKKVKAFEIEITNYKDVNSFVSKIHFEGIDKVRGYDINILTAYIMEGGLIPNKNYEIEGDVLHNSDNFGGIDNIIDVDFVVKLKEKKELKNKKIDLRSFAFDLETDALDPRKGEVLMVSIVGKNYRKVITQKGEFQKKYVKKVKNEKELISEFLNEIKRLKPDFIIGYNSDSFDFPFLKQRAKMNKINFSIGLDSSGIQVSKGNQKRSKIVGITHIDLFKFIKLAYGQYMKSESFALNEVSKEFLGDEKIKFEFKHSSKLLVGDWKKYIEYNLQDSILTYNLFEKFYPDILEFSNITKEPIYNASRSGLSKQIDNYILHNLYKYNEIPEKAPTHKDIELRKRKGSVEGAFVYQPSPGIYENIVMFDFTSMHTSIIISHNLSKGTLTEKKSNVFESPEIEIGGKKKRFYFEKKKGFFPRIIEDIFNKRKEAKAEYKRNKNPITLARNNAFKVFSAAVHGYIGFYGSRYGSYETSATILALVRKYDQDIIEKIKKENYHIIMGDTDSVAFTRDKDSKEKIKNLLKRLNDELPGVMRLELEGFFKRGIWVTTRNGETGAKKKYALIDEEGNFKIRGFETVRRDWCNLARKTQDKIIRLILSDGNEKNALNYLKKVIETVRSRKVDLKDLIIKSQLKKPISEYKLTSPAVVAAKKMKLKDSSIGMGSIIEYYIGESGSRKELIRDKVKLIGDKGKYDIDYYLHKQILPSVENIFQVFGINVKEIIEGKKQENLNKWF